MIYGPESSVEAETQRIADHVPEPQLACLVSTLLKYFVDKI
jgi:hypothetical protein